MGVFSVVRAAGRGWVAVRSGASVDLVNLLIIARKISYATLSTKFHFRQMMMVWPGLVLVLFFRDN